MCHIIERTNRTLYSNLKKSKRREAGLLDQRVICELYDNFVKCCQEASQDPQIINQGHIWSRRMDGLGFLGQDYSLFQFLKESSAISCPRPVYNAWSALYLSEEDFYKHAVYSTMDDESYFSSNHWLLLLNSSDVTIAPQPGGYNLNVVVAPWVKLKPSNEDQLGGHYGCLDDDSEFLSNGIVCRANAEAERHSWVNRSDNVVPIYGAYDGVAPSLQ